MADNTIYDLLDEVNCADSCEAVTALCEFEYSDPKWTTVRSKSTATKCLIGACHYLSILNNVKPASHHKVALGLTLLRILSKVDKPINAGIHVRNVGTQFSGITVL